MRHIIDSLRTAGWRFTVDPDRVRATWCGEGDPQERVLLDRLTGTTPRQYVVHVLGAELCVARPGEPDSHGSGLPWGLCGDSAFSLPCRVLLGRVSFAEWEAAYRELSEGGPSAYTENYERLCAYIGPDPIVRLRALFRGQHTPVLEPEMVPA